MHRNASLHLEIERSFLPLGSRVTFALRRLSGRQARPSSTSCLPSFTSVHISTTPITLIREGHVLTCSSCEKMSQTARSHRTTTTINVSQGVETPAHSSPPREQAPPEGTQAVVDSLDVNAPAYVNAVASQVVKDSMEGQATANPTKRARSPSQQAEDDELYSVTPERTVKNAAKALPQPTAEPQPPRKVSKNALDHLLSQGATVHKAPEQPAVSRRAPPIVEGEFDVSRL